VRLAKEEDGSDELDYDECGLVDRQECSDRRETDLRERRGS
jgi:hypothetical protein